MQVRVTGVLVENSKILILCQATDTGRRYSLPGGRLEAGWKKKKEKLSAMRKKRIGDAHDVVFRHRRAQLVNFLVQDPLAQFGMPGLDGLDYRCRHPAASCRVELANHLKRGSRVHGG